MQSDKLSLLFGQTDSVLRGNDLLLADADLRTQFSHIHNH